MDVLRSYTIGHRFAPFFPFFVALSLVLGWPVARPDAIVSTFGRDYQRSGFYEGELKKGSSAIVYFVSDFNWLRACDALTGRPLWKRRFRGALISPIILNGVLFVGSGIDEADKDVYSIDASTGKTLGRFETDGAVYSLLVVDRSTIVALASDYHLYQWELKTGRLSTKLPTKVNYFCGLTAVNEMIFVGGSTYDSELRRQWGYAAHELSVLGAPIIDGDRLIHAVKSTMASSAVSKKGSREWEISVTGSITNPLAYDKGTVVARTDNGMLYAIESASGKVLWKKDLGRIKGVPYGSPGGPSIGAGDLVISYDHQKERLAAYRIKTGEVAWSTELSGPVCASAAVAHARVYIGTLDRVFYCLSLADGSIVWSTKTSGQVTSGASVADGE